MAKKIVSKKITIKELKNKFKINGSTAKARQYFKDFQTSLGYPATGNFRLGYIDKNSKDYFIKFANFFSKKLDPPTMYVVDATGNIGRIEKNNKPLMATTFDYDPDTNISNNLEVDNDYGGVIFLTELDATKKYNLDVHIDCEIEWSDKWWRKQFSLIKYIAPIDLDDFNIVDQIIRERYGLEDEAIKLNKVEIFSTKTEQKFERKDMILREAEPLLLTQLYNEVIEVKNGNCVQTHLNKIYSKFSKKEIKSLQTPRQINEYCIKHNIKHICYDIKGKVIISNYPKKPNSSRKALIYIAYHNHIYPLQNHTLKKVKPLPKKAVYVIDTKINELFVKMYNKQGPPSDIKMRGDKIISFSYDDKTYHSNHEYEKCLDILSRFGLEDKMTVHTKIANIGEIIEELYRGDINADSFIPGSDKLAKGAFNYNNEETLHNIDDDDIEENLITIDKNKCYSYILSILDHLIKVDQKRDNMKKMNISITNNCFIDIEQIIDYHLYIVEPLQSTILLPHKNIYSGKHIKYCIKEGVEFNILEEQEGYKVDNYFKNMVIDLYNIVGGDNFKNIMNPLMGRFESSDILKKGLKVDQIGGQDDADSCEGHKINIAYNVVAVMKETNTFNLYNKKPISIQIKDASRVALYEMMKKLELTQEDVIQVKTDSITFYNNNRPYKNKIDSYKKFINQDLEGWKIEQYKPIKPKSYHNNNNITFELESDDNENLLCDCYAGSGKTYKIKNEIIPLYNEDTQECTEKPECVEKPECIVKPEPEYTGDCGCGIQFKNICNCNNPQYILDKLSNNLHCNSCKKWKCRCTGDPKNIVLKVNDNDIYEIKNDFTDVEKSIIDELKISIEKEESQKIHTVNKGIIITTPSHATIKEYRKMNSVKCDVIQKFDYFNIIPTQHTIVVDEIGMVNGSGWNWLYKCKLLGKRIMCYGDRNQLLPPGSMKTYFSDNWINYFFKHFELLDTNYRNDFTKEYYDSLINSTDEEFLINEIKKYNTPNPEDADVIISFRNKAGGIRKKYNDLMCNKLNIKSKVDIGASLICNCNDLREYEVFNRYTGKTIKQEIINNQIFYIIKDDDDDIEYKFTEQQINKYFDFAYCRTLYSIQGASIPSFHYVEEDLQPGERWITGRFAYTLISRLKTKNL